MQKSGKGKRKRKNKIDKLTVVLIVAMISVSVLTCLFIKMLLELNGKSADEEEESTTEEAYSEDTGEPGSVTDFGWSEDIGKADRDEEREYVEKNLYDSWYNTDIYRALCEDVPDSYFEKVCFLGDSRTMGLLEYSVIPEWHGFYKVGSTAAAACIERAYTIDGENMMNILDIISNVDYDIYYVGYGTNELGYGDPDKFIEELKVVIDTIKEYHPTATVYIENVLPMGERFSDNNPNFSNERAVLYNKKIKEMCEESKDLIYLDIASLMTDENGTAKEEYISDGLHYTPEGYRVIMNYIKSAVVERRR